MILAAPLVQILHGLCVNVQQRLGRGAACHLILVQQFLLLLGQSADGSGRLLDHLGLLVQLAQRGLARGEVELLQQETCHTGRIVVQHLGHAGSTCAAFQLCAGLRCQLAELGFHCGILVLIAGFPLLQRFKITLIGGQQVLRIRQLFAVDQHLLLRRSQLLVGRRYLRQRGGKLLHGHAGLDPCRDQQIHHTGRKPIQLRVRIRGLGTGLDGGLLCFIQLVQLLCNVLVILLCAAIQLIQLLLRGFLCCRQQVVRAHARQHLFIGGSHFRRGLGGADGLRRLCQQLFDLLTLGRGGDGLDLPLVAVVQAADHLLAALLLQKLPVKQGIAAVDAANAVHQSLKQRIRRQYRAFLHAVALTAFPAHHEPASALAHCQARIILAVYGIACQRAYQRSGRAYLQSARVIAVLQCQAFIAVQRAGRVFALLAAQDTADDGAARHGAGIIAAAYRDAACRRKADDAACAALSQQYSAGIIGHRALIGALVQRDSHAAVTGIAHDTAHAGRPACIDRAGIDAALQLRAGTDKAHDAALAAVTAGTTQIVGARCEGGIDPALIPAIRDLMAAAAGETAYQTAHCGILGFLIVDEGDGDIYLRHAAADGHAAALAAAQQTGNNEYYHGYHCKVKQDYPQVGSLVSFHMRKCLSWFWLARALSSGKLPASAHRQREGCGSVRRSQVRSRPQKRRVSRCLYIWVCNRPGGARACQASCSTPRCLRP